MRPRWSSIKCTPSRAAPMPRRKCRSGFPKAAVPLLRRAPILIRWWHRQKRIWVPSTSSPASATRCPQSNGGYIRRTSAELCINDEYRAQGGANFMNTVFGSIGKHKITFCPHFVRFRGKIGGYVATHNPLTLLGTQDNEKASMRGRVRARDDGLVAKWWFAGARDGNRRVQWDARLNQYFAYQERAQTDPGAGALLGASRDGVA